MASVRRRRRDLALLKTLGFTERQLIGRRGMAGVGVGGHRDRHRPAARNHCRVAWLWTLFAHQIYAVPQPSVPVLAVTLVALGTLVLANVVAALPGLIAARTPTALLLRAE